MSTKRQRAYKGFRDRYEWNEEKEPSYLHASPARAYAPVNESLSGSSIMTCCGEFRCVCKCPECDAPSVAGIRCTVCDLAYERQLERDKCDAFALTDMTLKQLREAGLL
jgi:hypothetical protein